MNAIDISHLPLGNKTLAQLNEEVRSRAHYFTNKYERCIYNKRYTVPMLQFYRKAKDTYFEFHELLSHIYKYDAITSKQKCFSCKCDDKHVSKLLRIYNQYYHLILKCKDGYRFKKAIVLCNDI